MLLKREYYKTWYMRLFNMNISLIQFMNKRTFVLFHYVLVV